MHRVIKVLFFNILTVLVLFLLAEGVSRLIWGKQFLNITNLQLMWFYPPQQDRRFHPNWPKTMSVGEDTFRVSLERLEDSDVDILIVGDSQTFGWGVNDSEAWPTALERALREKGIKANVYNGGVAGYSTEQILARWRREIGKRSFDVTLFGLTPGNEARYAPQGAVREQYISARKRKAPLRHSTFFTVLWKLLRKPPEQEETSVETYTRRLMAGELDTTDYWDPYYATWDELARDPRSGKVGVVLLEKEQIGYSEGFLQLIQSDSIPFADGAAYVDSVRDSGKEIRNDPIVGHYLPELYDAIGRIAAIQVLEMLAQHPDTLDVQDYE